MGVHKQLYFGPVFKVKRKTIEDVNTINLCSNKDCINNRLKIRINDPFCSACGSKSESNSFPINRDLNLREVSEIFPDIYDYVYDPLGEPDLACPNHLLLLPNYITEEVETLNNSEERFVIDPLNYVSKENLDKFKNLSKSKLTCDMLTKVFGEDSVTIEILLIQYYS